MKRIFLLVLAPFAIIFPCLSGDSHQDVVGRTVKSIQLTDANDKPQGIPFLGQYVVSVFYTDPDQKDVNEPLSAALAEKNFSGSKYKGMGIGNCADTWLPNAAIRMGTRQKQEKYPGAVILLDQESKVSKEWGLGDCDDAGVVIIIGKDCKIKYMRAVKSQEESKAITPHVLKIIEQEISK